MAYLILPGEYGIMNRTPLQKTTIFHATILIDPSISQAPSDDQKALFRTAMAKLDLEVTPNGSWAWTEGRPTSERYQKTRRELATIEERGAESGPQPFDGRDGGFNEWIYQTEGMCET